MAMPEGPYNQPGCDVEGIYGEWFLSDYSFTSVWYALTPEQAVGYWHSCNQYNKSWGNWEMVEEIPNEPYDLYSLHLWSFLNECFDDDIPFPEEEDGFTYSTICIEYNYDCLTAMYELCTAHNGTIETSLINCNTYYRCKYIYDECIDEDHDNCVYISGLSTESICKDQIDIEISIDRKYARCHDIPIEDELIFISTVGTIIEPVDPALETITKNEAFSLQSSIIIPADEDTVLVPLTTFGTANGIIKISLNPLNPEYSFCDEPYEVELDCDYNNYIDPYDNKGYTSCCKYYISEYPSWMACDKFPPPKYPDLMLENKIPKEGEY